MAYILVIDDEADVRKGFERALSAMGHVVSQAVNGADGLRMILQDRTDLVITDIFMPTVDGLEVILEIKKLARKFAVYLPVIAMSGGVSTRNAKCISFLNQAKTFGADRVFEKPVDFVGIQSAIEELLAVPAA